MPTQRQVTVRRAAKTPEVITTNSTTRRVRVTRSAPTGSKPRTLYFFQNVPGGGKTLRAYLIGMILAQIGGLKPNLPFKLWPAANVSGHTKNGRMKRDDSLKGGYKLTQSGVTYFAAEAQQADKDMVSAMVAAVKTGSRPPCHNYEMSQMTL